MGDTPTCEYREWLPDDEGQPTGPVCGRPARWFSCAEYIDQPVCDEHRCRCRKPIATNRTDGRLTMGDEEKAREELETMMRAIARDADMYLGVGRATLSRELANGTRVRVVITNPPEADHG